MRNDARNIIKADPGECLEWLTPLGLPSLPKAGGADCGAKNK
jgi:hypothetical protein